MRAATEGTVSMQKGLYVSVAVQKGFRLFTNTQLLSFLFEFTCIIFQYYVYLMSIKWLHVINLVLDKVFELTRGLFHFFKIIYQSFNYSFRRRKTFVMNNLNMWLKAKLTLRHRGFSSNTSCCLWTFATKELQRL